MKTAAPDIILELLVGPRGLDERAAYLRVDDAGVITHAGGRLDRFFDRPPVAGQPTEDWPWLDSLPVPGEAERIEIFPQRWADIMLRPGADGARWILLTEATASLATMQAILQRTQELTLASHDQRQLGDALRVLDAAVLRPTSDFRFRVLAPPPEWFVDVHGPGGTDPLDLASTWTFLESFRAQAENVWRQRGDAVVRSGIWSEGPGVNDTPLEATAVCTAAGDRLLIVQRVQERFENRQRVLQQARDLTIQHHRLTETIEEKEVLLHCVVHDLGSPLGAIVGCLDAVQPTVANEPSLQTLVQIGLRQARRQSSLIDQLLDVFKADIESLNRFDPPGDRPDLGRVVRDQVEVLSAVAGLHGVHLRPAVPDFAVFVSASGDRLERVVANLVENAIRHSPRGETVELEVSVDAQAARFEVRDRGPGVPEALRPTLFEKLQQGPGRGKTGRGKAGLGLYFCRLMVNRWSGDIGYRPADDGEPRGSCFWFTLLRAP